MDTANKIIPKVPKEETDEEKTKRIELTEEIERCRKIMVDFAYFTSGIVAVHPDPDPTNWPEPLGQRPFEPQDNVLRKEFKFETSEELAKNFMNIGPILLTE